MNKSILNIGLIFTLILLSMSLSAEDKMTPSESKNEVLKQTAMEHGVKHQDPNYVCPMHSQIIRSEPGSCPICGMDLVLIEEDEDEMDAIQDKGAALFYRHPHDPSITSKTMMQDESGMDFIAVYEQGGVTVKVSPDVVQNMGVRTDVVNRTRLWRRIDTVGYVDYDENKLSHIHLRTDGWIERLVVKSEGDRIKKGDVLFSLYSPTLVNAQEEYVEALNSGSKSLIGASADRLRSLGVSDNQVKTLKKTKRVMQRLNIYAPRTGIIDKLNVREGMYIKPATELMTLADLSSVWLQAEIFESQADWVKVGASAEVRLSYLPGRVWEGKVEYIYPSLDAKTRTLKARLRFDNLDESLKPNMFANITIYGGAKSKVLAIPREALIRSGKQNRVILSLGNGRFKPRKVTPGIEAGDWIEIIEGLTENDVVVSSGQFLIDSEASLKASIRRMSDTASELIIGGRK